jgi:ketosteroid isomerase-like protein
MKRLITLVLVLVCSLALTTVASASDADDVKAAVLAVDAAYSNSDVETILKYLHPEHSRFANDGGLVNPVDTAAELKASFEAGNKLDLRARHMDVKIYGNTGVVTYYTVVADTQPDGSTLQSTTRDTEVWVKQRGGWKRVHIHSSPLTPAQD